MDNEITRQEEIRSKGFDFFRSNDSVEFGKIKVGVRSLDDAVLDLGSLKKCRGYYFSKDSIMLALAENDTVKLREISNFFYRTNGIYQKICNYFASMYRYDWYLIPRIYDKKFKEEKISAEFTKISDYFDNSHIKKLCGDMILNVIKNGCYYGYLSDTNDRITIQELPVDYCRVRYYVNANPAVEFNMKFFDDKFSDVNYRMRIIKMFPKEFAKGYLLFKEGKLAPDYVGDVYGSWYLLDPEKTIKFNINSNDVPLFVNAAPAIIDLDAAQDLDRKKQMQKLLKIIIQKLPLDKNGDLVFDVDEARDIHENAVEMLSRAVGVDILTTFADVDSIDLSDSAASTTIDDLEKVERTVYNSVGISRNLFNTDGNLSLEKSILNDEGSIRQLVYQLELFFDRLSQAKSTNKKKCVFKFHMLETTQYNYKELSKLYKEQAQTGYSRLLSQIALGHSQSSIMDTAYFENNVLDLETVMIPPLTSATMTAEDLTLLAEDENGAGRPEKPDDEKSEKTIQNLESMS